MTNTEKVIGYVRVDWGPGEGKCLPVYEGDEWPYNRHMTKDGYEYELKRHLSWVHDKQTSDWFNEQFDKWLHRKQVI